MKLRQILSILLIVVGEREKESVCVCVRVWNADFFQLTIQIAAQQLSQTPSTNRWPITPHTSAKAGYSAASKLHCQGTKTRNVSWCQVLLHTFAPVIEWRGKTQENIRGKSHTECQYSIYINRWVPVFWLRQRCESEKVNCCWLFASWNRGSYSHTHARNL